MAVYLSDSWLKKELACLGIDAAGVEHIISWVHVARQSPPVLFAGSGLSRNAEPVPDWQAREPDRAAPPEAEVWGGLRSRLLAVLPASEQGEADPAFVAQLVEEERGRQGLRSILGDAVPEHLLKPDLPHLALTAVPWHCVLTTNWDRLVERVFAIVDPWRSVRSISDDPELAQPPEGAQTLAVIHPHGDFASGAQVATTEDYASYLEERPGLDLKARQLMLEHPVLFVGTGTDDPNLRRWLRWVDKVGGQHRLKAINLHVGDLPSPPRRRYFDKTMDFVFVESEWLAPIFRLLGRALRPAHTEPEGRATLMDQAKSIVSEAADIPAVIRAVKESIPDLRRGVGRTTARYRTEELAGVALEQAVRLGHADPGLLLEQLGRVDREMVGLSGEEVVGGWPVERYLRKAERLAVVRSAFGSHWLEMVELLALYLGRVFSMIPGVHYVDAAAELEAAPLEARNRRPVERLLAWWKTWEAAERGGLTEQQRDDFDQRFELIDEEVAALDDAGRRCAYRAGGPATAPADPQTAQEHRCVGFLAGMRADWEVSFEHYARAAELSRVEEEEPAIQWLTVNSALETPGAPKPEQMSMIERLRRRLGELKSEGGAEVRWFEDASDSAQRQWREDLLRDSLRGPSSRRRTLGPFGTGSARLLSIAEHRWISPLTVARQAEQVGWYLWRSGEHADAIDLFARAGSPLAGKLAERSLSDREPGPAGIAQPLLRPGRWPQEWRVKLEVLRSHIFKLTPGEVAALPDLLSTAAEALSDGEDLVPQPGGAASSYYRGPEALAAVVALVAKYLPAQDGMRFFETSIEAAQGWFRRSLMARYTDVPLLAWSRHHPELQPMLVVFASRGLDRALTGPERSPAAGLVELLVELESEDAAPIRRWLEAGLAEPHMEVLVRTRVAGLREESSTALDLLLESALGTVQPDSTDRGDRHQWEVIAQLAAGRAEPADVGSLVERLDAAIDAAAARLGQDYDEISFRFRTLSRVACTLLRVSDQQDRVFSLILRCLGSHPGALAGLALLDPDNLSHDERARLDAAAAAMLSVSRGVAGLPRLAHGLAALRHYKEALGGGWPATDSNLLSLSAWTACDDAFVARHAIGALGILARHAPSLGCAQARRAWGHAIAAAAPDPSVLVRGAVAWTLTTAERADPSLTASLPRATDLMGALHADQRVEVQFGLKG